MLKYVYPFMNRGDTLSKLDTKCEILEKDEYLEELGKGIKIICSPIHAFGTDAILLQNFSSPKKTDKCVDLGTGCGIIPFLWKRDGVTGEIKGVDIQEHAVSQFNRSQSINENCENLEAIQYDLRKITDKLKKGYFNVVTMNPPYKPSGTGILSELTEEQIARHEVMCTIDDACKAAEELLNFGGKFVMCHRPERLSDVICAMRAHSIEPKRIRFVQKRPDTAPWLFLIEGKKGSKPYMEVMSPLFIQDENGNDSKELIEIIGEYRD